MHKKVVKFILKEMKRIKNKLFDMKINFWRALWLTEHNLQNALMNF